DGSGQTPQAVDAMRLRQLLLEHLPLGDVAGVEQQAGHARTANDRLDDHLEGTPGGAMAADANLDTADVDAVVALATDEIEELLAIVRMDDRGDRFPHQILRRARAGVADHSFGVDDADD